MNENSLLHGYQVVGAILFGVGLVGLLSRRNMIVMFIAVEIMLQGISVSLVAWGRYHDNWDGQILVIFVLTIAACEAALAMALILMLFHRSGSLDIVIWQNLREANQPAYFDEELPDLLEAEPTWPDLAPAGVEPAEDPEEAAHRSHV